MFESKEERYVRYIIGIAAIIIGIAGFVLIGLVDWRLAVGIFLLWWAWGLENRGKGRGA